MLSSRIAAGFGRIGRRVGRGLDEGIPAKNDKGSGLVKTSEFIELAEAEITKGWCRHVTEDEHRNVCMFGAYQRVWAHHSCCGRLLYQALTLTAAMIAELGLAQLSDLLGPTPPETVIATFNDHRAKDKDEVLAVMGKTRLHCQEAGD